MRVEVERRSCAIFIRWRPFEDIPQMTWEVQKRLDISGNTVPLPVENAYILPGSATPYPCSPEGARQHAGELIHAASLCDKLNGVIRERKDFQRIEIEEDTHADPLKLPIRIIDRRGVIEIHIPDQSEYLTEQLQHSEGLMQPFVDAAERKQGQ